MDGCNLNSLELQEIDRVYPAYQEELEKWGLHEEVKDTMNEIYREEGPVYYKYAFLEACIEWDVIPILEFPAYHPINIFKLNDD